MGRSLRTCRRSPTTSARTTGRSPTSTAAARLTLRVIDLPPPAGDCNRGPRTTRLRRSRERVPSVMGTIGRVVSVNIGQPATVHWHDRDVTSAIWKRPVAGRHRVAGVNVDGDDQADRRVHGGPTKSVYAYAAEDYAWWARARLSPRTWHLRREPDCHRHRPRRPVVGERWRIGTAMLGSPSPGSRASSSACAWATPASSTASRMPAAPAPTWPSSTAGELGASDAIALVTGPTTAHRRRGRTRLPRPP